MIHISIPLRVIKPHNTSDVPKPYLINKYEDHFELNQKLMCKNFKFLLKNSFKFAWNNM